MKDISGRPEVQLLVESFYQKVLKDELISIYFTEVVQLDWDVHIPRLVDFWESILLGTQRFDGNPISPHIELHKKRALKQEHFDRWLELWISNIDQHFEGPAAEEAKRRAKLMAPLMLHKIQESQKDGFIQ